MTIYSALTWAGHDIRSATYRAGFVASAGPLGRRVTLRVLDVPGGLPSFGGHEIVAAEDQLIIAVRSSDPLTTIAQLQQWFAPGTEGSLIVDFDGEQRARDGVVQAIRPHASVVGLFVADLVFANPWWRSVSHVDEAATIISSGETLEFENPGNAKDRTPVITLAQNSQKDPANGQQHLREVIVTNRATRRLSRHPVLITFDHAGEVTAGRSHVTGDGRDVRLYVNGQDTPFDVMTASGKGWNETTTTLVVTKNMDFAPAETATLLADITSGSPADGGDLEVQPGGTDGMPASGRLVNPSSGECIAYSGITKHNANGREAFTGVVRGVRNTTAASGTAGDTLYLDELDVVLLYGWTGATAPDAHPELATHLNLASANLSNTRQVLASYLDERKGYEGRSPSAVRMPPVALDSRYDRIKLAGGSPLTTIVQEYDPDGASAGAPNHNVWRYSVPTGTDPNGTLDFTRELDATLALIVTGLTAEGLWVPVATIEGPQTSGQASITLPAVALYEFEFRTRSQVAWSEGDDGTPAEVNGASGTGTYIELWQAVQFESAGVWKKTRVFIEDDSPGSGTLYLAPDSSGAPDRANAVTLGSLSGTGAQEWVTVDHTDYWVEPGVTYWLGGQTPTTQQDFGFFYRRGQLSGLGCYYLDQTDLTLVPIFGRMLVRAISSDIATLPDQADADDGAQVTVTALDVELQSSTVPYVAVQGREDDVYQYLNAVVRLEQTGNEVQLDDVIVRVGDELTITMQPGAGRVENITRDERLDAGVDYSDPNVGIEVLPATNTLTYEETGVISVDLGVRFFQRWE